jgi:hypothetical protein
MKAYGLMRCPNSVLNMYGEVVSSSYGMDRWAAVRAVPMLQLTTPTSIARILHCYQRAYSVKL